MTQRLPSLRNVSVWAFSASYTFRPVSARSAANVRPCRPPAESVASDGPGGASNGDTGNTARPASAADHWPSVR